MELLFLGRTGQRGGRGLPLLDRLGDRIEVAGADLALVLDRGEAALGRFELGFLQLHEGAHLPARIAVGQIEHAVVQRVETGQGDELELVAVAAQLLLEPGNGGVVQVLLPVEAGRAVVGQQLARELRMDRLGELPREFQVRLAGLAPHKVGIRCVGQAAADGLVQAVAGLVEALHGALAGGEWLVVAIDVAGQQISRFGVGTCHQQGRHAQHVGGQPRGVELLDRLAGRHQHLATHVPALLHRGQLVFEVHAGSTGFDHRLHQLEGVEHAAETGFGVGHDRLQEVDVILAFGMVQLVGTQQRVVDALDHRRHRIGRVQRLVRVHLPGQVGIGRHLPAGQVDRLQPGLHLLHGLVAGQRAERVDEVTLMQRLPQLFRAQPGQRMLDMDGATQAHHVGGAVVALDAFPARIGVPVVLDLFGSGQGAHVYLQFGSCGCSREGSGGKTGMQRSVDARVRRQGQEVGQFVAAAQLGQQGDGFFDAAATGQRRGIAKARGQLRQGGIEQCQINRGAVVQLLARGVQPLPQLAAADFGGGRVLHQVVDRHAAVAIQPCGQVAHADFDIAFEASAGDRARRPRDQFIATHAHILAQHVVLVGRGHVLVEDCHRHRNQRRMGDPRAVVASSHFACAPRRWQVWISSSEYAFRNGWVMVTWPRSGSTRSAWRRKVFRYEKM
eukprot:TRINITY_DN67867_c0_g8_i3.p1 TRINITY_DN67867_c0_g8~~TRINITY_DN67867_c0_g8_i3.p1  ORF type:complete len:672 (-),score=294.42 TRINITY_DN67867_c0_g8_i3:1748-3763(-)